MGNEQGAFATLRGSFRSNSRTRMSQLTLEARPPDRQLEEMFDLILVRFR